MGNAPTILCIDDQDMNLQVRALLLRQFGCEVLTVNSHGAAMHKVEEESVDLVMIDYHLAKGELGDQLARDIRVLKPELPLVMLTGDPKISEEAQHTVDAVLIKGVSGPAELWETIQRLVPGKKLKPRRGPFEFEKNPKAS